MKKRLARLVELSREQSQTAQDNLKLAQDSARLAGKQGPKQKSRWWQLKHFLFLLLFGEDSHFD